MEGNCTLDLVVFESDPDQTATIALANLKKLIEIGADGPPIPVIPTKLFDLDFKIITYPPKATNVIRYADTAGIRFKRVYGVLQTRLLYILPSPEEWQQTAILLGTNRFAAWWLMWGVDLLVLDKDELNVYIKADARLGKLIQTCEKEYAMRSLDSLI